MQAPLTIYCKFCPPFLRQIEANRRNAQLSTGPVTEEGKRRSRQNAVQHGLTAETVIDAREDAEDYAAFEMAVTADYESAIGCRTRTGPQTGEPVVAAASRHRHRNGIAGEDDLDAPDLPAAGPSPGAQKNPIRSEQGMGGMDQPAIELKFDRPAQTSNGRARAERSKPASLSADASANLRNRLIAELEQLVDPEALAIWAQRALPLKIQLATADAQTVEAAFAARLSQLGNAAARPESDQANGHHGQSPSTEINAEGVIAIGKPVRERDRDHLKFVTSQPCLVCGRTPSDAHHIKFAEQRAMGRKVSDKFTVPICRLHHRELHRRGNERVWWEAQGIDPLPIATSLWEKTHAVASTATEDAGDVDRPIKVNGRYVADGPGARRPCPTPK